MGAAIHGATLSRVAILYSTSRANPHGLLQLSHYDSHAKTELDFISGKGEMPRNVVDPRDNFKATRTAKQRVVHGEPGKPTIRISGGVRIETVTGHSHAGVR